MARIDLYYRKAGWVVLNLPPVPSEDLDTLVSIIVTAVKDAGGRATRTLDPVREEL